MDWIQNNISTVVIGIILLLVIFKGLIIGKIFGIKNISVEELAAKIKDHPNEILIVDVRTTGEFSSGYIKNSQLIPMTELPGKIDRLASMKKREIAVICATGGRSIFGASTLKKAGFKNVYNVSGGIAGWKRHGYSVVK